ncbi:MAG: zinc-binding alcohol dehydrogenase family protein, partial [Sphingobacteriales bacterium]
MKAMVLINAGKDLEYRDVPLPLTDNTQVLVKVIACGVCRTDLHVMDGELDHPKLPLIPGHEIIGVIVRKGQDVNELKEGEVVGVPWLGYTCGECRYCLRGRENLCEKALFTGYTIDGGFAEYASVHASFCFRLPVPLQGPEHAPLLCAGLIGYRSYCMCGPHAERIGLYGFGAAAHILIQVAKYEKKEVYTFSRPGDKTAREFALGLGAVWAGYADETCPVKLDAAIIFAPAGELVVKALQDTDKGGNVVCGGIHMSDIPSFPYELLWHERSIKSVANLTRKDAEDFIALAGKLKLQPTVSYYPLKEANKALEALRNG